MSIKDIPKAKLRAVARYLDGFPPPTQGQNEEDIEQYYCLLLEELSRLDSKFTYTRTQKATFGMAIGKLDGSPSLLLLHDLQEKGLQFNTFMKCLQTIGCQGALNELTAATTPEVVTHPQTQSLREGETLRLECEARCKPGPPQYFWFRIKDSDPNGGWEPLVDSNTNRLVIEDVNTNHTGVYVCRATNPWINDPNHANIFSNETRIEVGRNEIQQKTPIRQEEGTSPMDTPPEFPLITQQPETVRVEYGQPAALHCEARGTNILYDWFKDGKYVSTRNSAGSLVLKRVRLEDGGEYYCKVTNAQGGSIKSATVSIIVDPVIVIDCQPPRTFNGDRNEIIELRCSAHSTKGPVTYQWCRNKKDIKGATSEKYRDYLNCNPDFNNTYTLHCRVSLRDSHGVALLSTPTKVTVNCIKIIEQPHNVQRETGESASLCCRAVVIPPSPTNSKLESMVVPSSSANNKIDYIWLKSDMKGGKKDPLPPALKVRSLDGRLMFEGLGIAHSGYYVCQACLKGQWVESDEVQLSVTMPGVARVTIVRHPVSWVVATGGEFRMICKATVTPPQPLHYQWFQKNEPIPDQTSPTLIRKDVCESDYNTSYYCEVKTDGGVVRSSDSAYLYQPAPKATSPKTPTATALYEAELQLSTISGKRYAREKIALLIGNQRYDSAMLNKLKHTEEEVRKVADKLRKLNFKVFTFVNLRLTEMDSIIKWFCSLLSAGMYGLFYFTGHGFKTGTSSYLMPVDLPEGSNDTKKCVPTDYIAHSMQKKACQAIMVLDCCQVFDDDSTQSGPISGQFQAFSVANILEIHSCPPGNVAYEKSAFNSSFIEALDQNSDINRLCNDILEKMRIKGDGATPWHSGSMKNEICLCDSVMRDDVQKAEDAEKVCGVWEQIQSIPDAVTLAAGKLNSLDDMVSLTLTCEAKFANVLVVKVEICPKEDDVTPSLTLDKGRLTQLGVEAAVEGNTDNLTYRITIRNIERLRESLSLPLVLTVHVPGSTDRSEHTLPLPLNTVLNFTS